MATRAAFAVSIEQVRPSADEVQAEFVYRPDTGILLRRSTGAQVGATNWRGYLSVSFKNRHQYVHRLAWVCAHGEWPEGEVDHINGVRDDNRLVNLRHATRQQNSFNSRRSRNNASGYKGVSFCRRRQTFRAYINLGGRQIHLGEFKTAVAAHEARKRATNDLHGSFGRA